MWDDNNPREMFDNVWLVILLVRANHNHPGGFDGEGEPKAKH